MRIKKFVGPSLKHATEQMREELGSDAVILSTRTLPRQEAGPGREMFEVTAAVEDPGLQRGTYTRKQAGIPFGRYLEHQADAATPMSTHDELRKLAEKMETRGKAEFPASRRDIPPQAAEIAGMLELKNEMESMRGTIRDLCDQMKHARSPELPPTLLEAYSTLLANDVEESIARKLVQAAFAALEKDQMGDKRATDSALQEIMAGMMKAPELPKGRRKKPMVIVLVGPTGVGKTTTIAKLAAIHKLVHGKSVGLISSDTYRIGAIEQLRTFAAIADIPMEVVYKPSELAAAMKSFRNRDLVLVDTVGRSHRSRKDIAELAKYVEALHPDETHLVVSASTAARAISEIADRFAVTKPNRILFTKLDEAVSLGPLFTVLSRKQLPVGYVTTGQTVPDDILAVEPAHLASMIYSGVIAHA